MSAWLRLSAPKNPRGAVPKDRGRKIGHWRVDEKTGTVPYKKFTMSKDGSNSEKKKIKTNQVNVRKDAGMKAEETGRSSLNNKEDSLNVQMKAIARAKMCVSKWKKYCTQPRKRKQYVVIQREKGTFMKKTETEQRYWIYLGLEDEQLNVNDDIISKSHVGLREDLPEPSKASATNRSLIQYFIKLDRSEKDDEVVDLNYVEQMLSDGVDINCTDKHGQTLLHEVASKWHPDVALFLIELGADPNKADNWGRCPLHVAAADDYPEMVKLLIDKKACREAQTKDELQRPVHYAAKYDATSALKMLIDKKCEYKKVLDHKGRSPLHVAAELDRSETARLLLEKDAPAGMTDNSGRATITWLIANMQSVAMEALNQFHSIDRSNKRQYFYLNHLVRDIDKDKDALSQTPLSVAVTNERYGVITHGVFLVLIHRIEQFVRFRMFVHYIGSIVFTVLWTVFCCVIEYDKRHLYVLPNQWWRIVLLISVLALTIWLISDEVRDIRRNNQSHKSWNERRHEEIEKDLTYCHPCWPVERCILLRTEQHHRTGWQHALMYSTDMWNWVDYICYGFLVAVVITHTVDIAAHTDGLARAHLRVTAFATVFLWLRLMKNARAFVQVGYLVIMWGKMTRAIIEYSLVFLLFFLIPFGCAYWIIFGGNKYSADSAGNLNRTEVTINDFEGFGETLFTLYSMTFGGDYPFKVRSLRSKFFNGLVFDKTNIGCFGAVGVVMGGELIHLLKIKYCF